MAQYQTKLQSSVFMILNSETDLVTVLGVNSEPVDFYNVSRD
jgi:hypothetical protein